MCGAQAKMSRTAAVIVVKMTNCHKGSKQRHLQKASILLLAIFLATIMGGAAASAKGEGEAALMNRVEASLRRNDRLNGAKVYTAAPGVVVLYGMVFGNKDRKLAERTSYDVPGVSQVIDNLRTRTGKWFHEEEQINAQLQMNGFHDVEVRVVGAEAYLSGKVHKQSEKRRAANVVASVSHLHINNLIRVEPGSIF